MQSHTALMSGWIQTRSRASSLLRASLAAVRQEDGYPSLLDAALLHGQLVVVLRLLTAQKISIASYRTGDDLTPVMVAAMVRSVCFMC